MSTSQVTAWLAPALPRSRVAWLRTFLYGFVWLDVLVIRPWVRDHGSVPRSWYRPLAVADLLHLPTPTPTVTTVVMVALLAASAIAGTGRLPRVAGVAVACLYLEWMVIAFSYGKVDHDRFAFLVALAVLPTVGRATRDDDRPDEAAGWAIRSIQLAVVATYVLSVAAKARYGNGLTTWLDSTTLVRAVVRRGTSLADPLLEVPWVLHAAQYGIVALELLSPLVLVRGWVGRAMLGALFGFHVVTVATIGILFHPHVMCLLAFLPLERLRQFSSANRRARRRRSSSPAPGMATRS